MALGPGTRLGPYDIMAAVGAGGMGQVFRARDTRLNREVALKILPAEVANDPLRRQRFEQEARVVAALNHPNIVAIHDVGEQDGVSYIITELVEGRSLRGLKPGLRKTLDIAVQVASGLAAAHEKGVIHRDLKPDNVLLTADGRVKILDFGLAKVTPVRSSADAATETLSVQTDPGVVMGTAAYMSPEQVRGQATDHRSDIFSFGVLLYELVAGSRAFHGPSTVETMSAILHQEAPELAETVPGALRQIVAHCLEKDPVNRFQSARDLGFALSSVGQSGSQSALSSAVAPRRALPKRWWLALAGLATLAAGVLAGHFVWRTPRPPVWSGVLLGSPEMAGCPRPSPDGHTVAFYAAVQDVFQVWVMKPESGNRALLTHDQTHGYVWSLSWSPDGTKIYYDRTTDLPRGIFSVPVLGGPEQPVLEDAGAPEALPDGSLLVARLNAQRRMQMFHFWPDSGRLQALPLEFAWSQLTMRAALDGREAFAVGTAVGSGGDSGIHLYAVDLVSGRIRKLETGLRNDNLLQAAVAVTRDGRSVLVAGTVENTTRILAVPRSGSAPGQPLLTLTGAVYSMDVGPDGAVYIDQWNRPAYLLKFRPEGGHVERIATFPTLETEYIAVLSDGRVVLPQRAGGHLRLLVVEAGKDPVPLVNTSEETTGPVTSAGPGAAAFLIGPEPRRTIALADVASGRIIRRVPLAKGRITSLAAADRKTIYAVADGVVWAVPTGAGEHRRVLAGDEVVVDASGQSLFGEFAESGNTKLVRVPANGGAEQTVPLDPAFRLASSLTAGGAGPDGRVLSPLGAPTWYWPPGLIDPATGRVTRIPVDFTADTHLMSWTPDGHILSLSLGLESTIWKFQPGSR